jgi:hypothetical protein
MAGLAGHPIQDLSMYGPMNGGNELGNSPLNVLNFPIWPHEATNTITRSVRHEITKSANSLKQVCGNSPLNGLQMSQELTNLFEAVGAFGNFMPNTSRCPASPAIATAALE